MGPVRDAGAAALRPLVVLGATGSIGRQALDVARRLGMEVRGLGARRGSPALLALAARHRPAQVAVAAPTPLTRRRGVEALGHRVAFGPEAITELASLPGCIVLNGIVGVAGLPASLAALEAGNRLALANKESLVAGGPLVAEAQHRGGGELIPVDSEHSALAQCLAGEDPAAVRRILLTASGGPFRGRSRRQLARAMVAEALAHPTWRMGRRITIDSATLMNKAFEVIEAHHLFHVPYERIEVIIHPQSVVHSLVEFVDGSLKAQLGFPDMRVPIQYALTYPDRREGPVPPFDLAGRSLTFERPNLEAFPCLRLGYEAGRAGGSAPVVLNAADEVAVRAFLAGRISLTAIPEVVERALQAVAVRPLRDLAELLAVDAEARAVASATWRAAR
jgi:1-deoxy-D-xylulose-5-phosphate reductoisomerase